MENHSVLPVSIIIPAYNEEKRITASLQDLKSFFKAFGETVEILLVIEKSTDQTVTLAQAFAKDMPQLRIIANDVQKGKGFAVKTGMLQARGELVFFMDLDLSTPLVEVVHFLSHFESYPETDILIGSRQHELSLILKKQHPLRQKMGQTFNYFVQLFAFRGIQDTQCGFKAFRRRTIKGIFSRQTIDGFSFDVEILLIAQTLAFKIEVLPVRWINSPHSKVRVVRDSFKMFFDLLKMKRKVRRAFLAYPVRKDQQ